MKIKTNLGPSDLARISKGIRVASKKSIRPYAPENSVEELLLSEADDRFDTMLGSLQDSIIKLLKEKE